MGSKGRADSIGWQVNALVAGLALDKASSEELASLTEQLCALGKGAVERLARGILRPGPLRREKVAALLACLGGEAAGWALRELRALLASRRLGPMERVWLSATARRLEEGLAPQGAAGEPPEAEGGTVFADPADLLEWRDEVAALDLTTQQQVLAPLLASGDPALLPFLEAAVSLGSPRLDAAVADGLRHFATAGTLPLLRELLRHADPEVRGHARATLVALARQGVVTSDVFVAATGPADPATTAYTSGHDMMGTMALLFAGHQGAGIMQYVVVVLDPIEEGVAEAWGESGLTEPELQECVARFASDNGIELEAMDLGAARALVAAAETFTRAQGRELPAEYFAWRHLIGPAEGSAELPVVFGPHCTECGSRLRTSDAARGGLAAGDVALCARCARRPRHCAACGCSLHTVFDSYVARRGKRDGDVEFLCMDCSRPRRRR